jgi:glycosyltransferase involved in cell wall biosynthesis
MVKCPLLSELPKPTDSRIGWPWTEETPVPSHAGGSFPKITIVTPNLNYGHFLEETIRSVLLQGYPNLEFMIIDGGSTDSSLEIVQKYEKWISYRTVEKGLGQAASINYCLRRSTGEIFNWINSDDLLMPGALHRIATLFTKFPDFQWLSGGRMMIDANSNDLYCELDWPTRLTTLAYGIAALPQDATFFRRSELVRLNAMRDDLENAFDSYLYTIFLREHPILLTRCVFSKMRLHRDQKTRRIDQRSLEAKTAMIPLVNALPLRSRLCSKLCFGKLGPIFLGLFEEYRQWAKGRLLLNEAWYDLAELEWKLVKK